MRPGLRLVYVLMYHKGEGGKPIPELEILSVVAVLDDIPASCLLRGQVGTVVDIWAPGVYGVEFCDPDGKTCAMAALRADQVMALRYMPVDRAA